MLTSVPTGTFPSVTVTRTSPGRFGSSHRCVLTDCSSIMLVFSVSSALLTVAGYDFIHLAQRWVAYVLIAALLVFSLFAALRLHVPPAQLAPGNFRAVPFLAQFFAAASYQISWSIYVSDYSRYLPRDVGVRASFWWTYVGAFVGGAWTMLGGTLAAAL